ASVFLETAELQAFDGIERLGGTARPRGGCGPAARSLGRGGCRGGRVGPGRDSAAGLAFGEAAEAHALDRVVRIGGRGRRCCRGALGGWGGGCSASVGGE